MQKTEKDFDAVHLMRGLRDEIDREVAGLTPDQRREYVRRRAERVRAELGLAAAETSAALGRPS